MNIDYKYTIVLLYIKTLKEEYTYKEMTNLLGLGYDNIDTLISDMEDKKLIYKDRFCIIKISKKGRELLKKNKLNKNYLYEIYEDYKIDSRLSINTININKIYIPRNFNKYFSGYK